MPEMTRDRLDEILEGWQDDPTRAVSELADEIERLWTLLGPDYHTIEIKEDGWSLKHPVRCREDMLACDLHRVIAEVTTEYGRAAFGGKRGRYKATLDEHGVVHLGDLPD